MTEHRSLTRGYSVCRRRDPHCTLTGYHVTVDTEADARKFLDIHRHGTDRDYSCCHDHGGCSTYDGGPCLDETLSNFPQLAE